MAEDREQDIEAKAEAMAEFQTDLMGSIQQLARKHNLGLADTVRSFTIGLVAFTLRATKEGSRDDVAEDLCRDINALASTESTLRQVIEHAERVRVN